MNELIRNARWNYFSHEISSTWLIKQTVEHDVTKTLLTPEMIRINFQQFQPNYSFMRSPFFLAPWMEFKQFDVMATERP